MHIGKVTETGEDIVKNVKAMAQELKRIQIPDSENTIHFVSDSAGAYKKARKILKEEGVLYCIFILICYTDN